MARRYYSSTAVQTTLGGSISNSATSFSVSSLTGFPNQTPWTAIIDADTASEEVVEVTNVVGTTVTVTRGVDGTAAVSHATAASFRHGVSARDFDEANDHVNDSTGVHGLGASSSVVGTSDTQTLTNKTINSASNSLTIAQSAVTNLVSDLAAKADVANPTITGVLSVPDGSASAPSITNTGDTNTGLAFVDADTVIVTTGGSERVRVGATGAASFTGVVSTPAGAVDQAMQYSAEESVLRNLPARVHPAEALLKQAVWWIDSAHSSANGQAVTNLGWGGSALNAQLGSTGSADSNDAKYLDWTGENYLFLPGSGANHATAPDEAALDLTADLTLTARVALDDWTPAATNALINKGYDTAYQWQVVASTGVLRLQWYDGSSVISASSTVAPTVSDGAALWVRVALDVDDGGAYSVKFYTAADSVDVPTSWSQLGTTVTGGATTSVAANASTLSLGGVNGVTPMAGKFYRAIVSSGLHTSSTPVLDIDCSAIASGAATSFTARTGQTVTINRSTTGRKAVAVTHPCWLLGTDDYMEVPDNDLIDFGASDSFSLFVAMRSWNNPSGIFHIFLGKGTSTNSGNPGYYLLRNNGAATARLQINDTSTFISSGTSTIANGSVTVLAGVRDVAADIVGSSINGSTLSTVTDTTTTSLSNSSALRVGNRSSGNDFADMEFVAAAVFRRALTAGEITTLSNYYSARIGA